ncbi:SMP-30/gluconolactonase/LRE family protein [Cupriavidus sp. 30B13]|uniref:SMP-30/gluconolactonase/LRE family protein n=1 Tax=Cupriavidus sp. 30B13 TaxID=3384241 RepID=UPI003B90E548
MDSMHATLLAPAPLVCEALVFSRMPDRFRTNTVSDWSESNRPGHPVDSFLEGPVFDRAGNLYVCDIPHGRIFRISPAGAWSLVAQYDGEPNGLKFYDDHRLIAADYRRGLVLIDVRDGSVAPHLPRRHSEGFKGLNDLIFDRAGNLYFTDQGQSGMHDPRGRLYRLAPDGRLDVLVDGIPSPNGVCLSPDERVLYLAVTRANAVWRVPLHADGGVSKVGVFFTSYGPAGPDGLAMTSGGLLLVANPGLGYVWVLNARAEPVMVIRSPAGTSVTNLAFGGPQRRTVYCTESSTGTVLRATIDQPGAPLASGERTHTMGTTS